jgi:hypothetical protein
MLVYSKNNKGKDRPINEEMVLKIKKRKRKFYKIKMIINRKRSEI